MPLRDPVVASERHAQRGQNGQHGQTGREPADPPTRKAGDVRRWRRDLAPFSGLFLWAIFIAVFAVWVPETFLTSITVRSILADQAITAVVALGLLFPLAAEQYDLSIAPNLGLSSVISATLMVKADMSPWAAILLTLAAGMAIGAANGFFVTVLGINSFIATMGMTSILTAGALILANHEYIGPMPARLQSIVNGQVLGVPAVFIYAVVVGVVIWYVLEHTPSGRRFFAVGANPEAARLNGVHVNRYVFASFVLSGLFAALAGTLLAAKVGQVSPDQGPEYLLPTFAACFLGTTQLKVGRFNVWGTLLALYLLATGVKGLQLAGGGVWATSLFNGVALLAAVGLAVAAERRRQAQRARSTRNKPERTADGGPDPQWLQSSQDS